MSRAEVGAKDDTLFFAVKTIGMSKYGGRKPQTLLDAARHNRRVLAAKLGPHSHINPARAHLNQNIAGPDAPDGVVKLAAELMTGAGVDMSKLRKDHTQAQELLFSLPADTAIDNGVFFGHCLDWTVGKFGRDAILSADIHLDEAAPHLHILLIPIADGRYLGSKLITRMELAKLRESFAELALTYGLREPIRRLHGARREQAAQMVLAHLEATHDPLLQSALWFTVKPDIVSNPARYAARLGIVLPEIEETVKKVKTMAQIFTSKGKGPKVERNQKPIGFKSTAADDIPKPIGFENSRAINQENTETIALLVSPKSHPPSLPAKPLKTEANDAASSDLPVDGLDGTKTASTLVEVHQEDHNVTRERDADNAADHWCTERGEFIQAQKPLPRRAVRQSANAWVAGELQARGRMKSNS